MTALKVIAIIVLVISALLLLRIKIVIEYADELTLYAKVLFFKIKIIPKKEKPVKISDYTQKRLLKRQKKVSTKEKKKTTKKQQAKPTEAKKEKVPILDTIRLVRLLLSIFLKRFFGRLRIDLARLNIIIGSGDAAKTAITYGYVCQGVAYLVELLDRFTNLRRTKNTEISVTTDFTAEKTTADIKLSFSLSVAGALDILFRTALGYVKTKMKI